MRLASRGLRDMDDGVSVIDDAAELRAVRVQARRVQRNTLAVTISLAALYVLLG